MYARNFFENKMFYKRIIKKPKKGNLTLFCTQSLLMDKIMKRERVLKLATSLSFICKTCLEKIPFLVIYHLGNFDDLIQSSFWLIPKITFSDLFKSIHDITTLPVHLSLWIWKMLKGSGKNYKNLNVSITKRPF